MSDPLKPRPDQVDALTALTRAFATHDRTQLIMACGTGKTLVGRWHAQITQASRVVVFAPSLALISQTLREWRRAGGWPFTPVIICSDPTTAAGAAERHQDHHDPDRAASLPGDVPVTTDPRRAAQLLARTHPSPLVVLSTYHSAPVVAQALAASRTTFDLAILDEAHRLAGRPRDEFLHAHDPKLIAADRRLYMTATRLTADDPPAGSDPGQLAVDMLAGRTLTMDDPGLFGPVAHTVTFAEAIGAGRLCDYRVLVVARHPSGDSPAVGGDLTVAALLEAIRRHGVSRILSYHGRLAKAAHYARLLDGHQLADGRTIHARHIAGTTPTDQRTQTLNWLADRTTSDEIRVVTNARCLVEGIDAPAVDAVLFADPRHSQVDIIQIIGRALRAARGKTLGSIIIPVQLPEQNDDDTELALTHFGHVWQILRGLRTHDERFASELDQALAHHASPGNREGDRPGHGHGPRRIDLDLPASIDPRQIELRLVEETSSQWERFYVCLQAYAARTGGRQMPAEHIENGVKIGKWAVRQRFAWRRGVIHPARIARLEQVPGWHWNAEDGHWLATARQLHEAAKSAPGGVAYSTSGQSAIDSLRDGQRRPMSLWAARARQAWRDGTLSPDRVAALEVIPGWTWKPVPADDAAMVDALRSYCEFEHHTDIPETHVEDGLDLGRWAWAVRRRKVVGRLHPALEADILAACPVGAHGETAWRWETKETEWRLGYSALRQFVSHEGHCDIPAGHVEELPDTSVNLHSWTARQRHQRRTGGLGARFCDWLDAIAGWQWEKSLPRRQYGDPLDLGGHPHGTAKGVAASCPCQPCLDAARATGRRFLVRQRVIQGGVPAEHARRHLAALQATGAKPSQLATAAKLPISVVQGVLTGRLTVISREHSEVLRGLGADDLDRQTLTGSRGRAITTGSQKVPSGPTLARIDRLVELGYPPIWQARELGYARHVQIGDALVLRRVADAIQDLHDRIGGRYAPPRSATNRPPRLADLEQRWNATNDHDTEAASA